MDAALAPVIPLAKRLKAENGVPLPAPVAPALLAVANSANSASATTAPAAKPGRKRKGTEVVEALYPHLTKLNALAAKEMNGTQCRTSTGAAGTGASASTAAGVADKAAARFKKAEEMVQTLHPILSELVALVNRTKEQAAADNRRIESALANLQLERERGDRYKREWKQLRAQLDTTQTALETAKTAAADAKAAAAVAVHHKPAGAAAAAAAAACMAVGAAVTAGSGSTANTAADSSALAGVNSVAALFMANSPSFDFTMDHVAARAMVRKQCGIQPYFAASEMNDGGLKLYRMFELYDQALRGALSAKLARQGHSLTFGWSNRWTRVVGQFAPNGAGSKHHVIRFSSNAFFRDYVKEAISQLGLTINGQKIHDRLDAIQCVMEHELVHLLLYLDADTAVYNADNGHGTVFMAVAKALFGHTKFTCDCRRPEKLGADGDLHTFAVGQQVSFESRDERHITGLVVKIGKKKLKVKATDNGAIWTVPFVGVVPGPLRQLKPDDRVAIIDDKEPDEFKHRQATVVKLDRDQITVALCVAKADDPRVQQTVARSGLRLILRPSEWSKMNKIC